VNEITMRLAPGTALLFDNWRLLHGRRAYQGYRRLCGAYLNMEDFASKLRILRAAR
jgi:trimethyllysine dioxygenase